jgi:hypothetical protein
LLKVFHNIFVVSLAFTIGLRMTHLRLRMLDFIERQIELVVVRLRAPQHLVPRSVRMKIIPMPLFNALQIIPLMD